MGSITMTNSKLSMGCTYAALILHDGGVEISSEKINQLLEAAGVNVDSYWPRMYAKSCTKSKMDRLITGIEVAAAPPAPSSTTNDNSGEHTVGKAEDKKPDSESEAELGFSIF